MASTSHLDAHSQSTTQAESISFYLILCLLLNITSCRVLNCNFQCVHVHSQHAFKRCPHLSSSMTLPRLHRTRSPRKVLVQFPPALPCLTGSFIHSPVNICFLLRASSGKIYRYLCTQCSATMKLQNTLPLRGFRSFFLFKILILFSRWLIQNRNRYFVSQFDIGIFCFTFISISVYLILQFDCSIAFIFGIYMRVASYSGSTVSFNYAMNATVRLGTLTVTSHHVISPAFQLKNPESKYMQGKEWVRAPPAPSSSLAKSLFLAQLFFCSF